MNEPLTFCDDMAMTYDASRRLFAPGERLSFDESYRLAHLPLVVPGHADVIRSVPDRDYVDGRYERPRHSLIAPVSAADLMASPVFREMEAEMRAASFAAKIHWGLCETRAATLHATIVNGLVERDIDTCAKAVADGLRFIDAITFRLGGPFIGMKNFGRIYFPVYPQIIRGEDAFALIQDACGAPRTRFYVVGYYHLTDALDAPETHDLALLLERWRGRIMAELTLSTLTIQATNDDLALTGRPVARIELGDSVALA